MKQLGDYVVLIEGDKSVYITECDNVLVNKPDEDCSSLMHCYREEVNTYMFVNFNDTLTKVIS